MKNWHLFCRLLTLLWMCMPVRAERQKPCFVDFDSAPALEAIFAGGLRPLHIYGLETSECEVRPPVELSIKFRGVTLPPIVAAWSFRINGDGRLRVIHGYGETPWTAAEALQYAGPYEKALGGDPGAMYEWLKRYPASSIEGDMWGRKLWLPSKEDPLPTKLSYYFRHSMQDARPFLMTVLIEVRLPRNEYQRGSTPLKPPPGYEWWDMNPYKKEQAPPPGQPAAKPEFVPEAIDLSWLWWLLLAFLAMGFLLQRWWNARQKRSRGL